MIMVTRRNGTRFALNPDLLERAEETPDTVLTLVAGTKYVVEESVDQIIEQIRAFRASVMAEAERLIADGPRTPHLRPVTDGGR